VAGSPRHRRSLGDGSTSCGIGARCTAASSAGSAWRWPQAALRCPPRDAPRRPAARDGAATAPAAARPSLTSPTSGDPAIPRPGHAPLTHRRQCRTDYRLRLDNDHYMWVASAYNWSVHCPPRRKPQSGGAQGRERSGDAYLFARYRVAVRVKARMGKPRDDWMISGPASCSAFLSLFSLRPSAWQQMFWVRNHHADSSGYN
jgi:hypothetical protein